MSRRSTPDGKQPTASVTGAELAVLQALWSDGRATVRQLADRLYPGGTPTDYATVQKLLQRLGDKGWVRRVPDSAPIEFEPTNDREALVARHVDDVVDRLCAGSITPLLSHLTRRELTDQDRRELSTLLDALQQRPPKPRRRR